MRSALVPALTFANPMSYIFFVIGILLNFPGLVWVGIICFALCFIFSLVTLPVEYNASMRAKELMVNAGVVSANEAYSAGKVLNAAFLTYVAAAISSLLTLLYYIWRSGLFRNDD
jgi:Zn-dependent membrane protease YugP